MSSTEIKYTIDNQEKNYEELSNMMESLPQEAAERFVTLFENGNIEEIYNIVNNINPNSGITLSSLKLLCFLQDPELKNKLFSTEEYISLLKDIVDMYGEGLSEIINTNSTSFKMRDLDFLLSFNNPKYSDIYKSILVKKLTSTSSLDDFVEVLKNSNIDVVDEEFITNFLENRNYLDSKYVIKFLKSLPHSILQDGIIAKKMVEKISNISVGDEEILDYIPSSAYTPEFVNEILDKSHKVFDYIPTELRTMDIWERACNSDTSQDITSLLNKLPNNNIDPSISQEEYISWVENLITRKITEEPKNALHIFSHLDDEKKTASLCQKVAESIFFEGTVSFKYNELLECFPESSRTRLLYETLVAKSPNVLRDIPLESFLPNISQEEYDKWFENLISQCITNFQIIEPSYMDILFRSIPRSKMNERIWNEFLDKCITENVDKNLASLNRVDFKNLTTQMVERAMKEIKKEQLFYAPCVDQNLDNLDKYRKDSYAKWQASLTEKQKQTYRTWYEETWIKYVSETRHWGDLYSWVPKEAITTAMIKACIDVDIDFSSIEKMPIPETPEQIQEYQQMLIYALSKFPTIDYINRQNTILYGDKDIFEKIPNEFISEEVVRQAIKKSIIYLSYVNPMAENFNELIDIAFKNKLASMGRTKLTPKEHELMQKFALNNADFFKTLKLEILDPKIVSAIGESSLEKLTRYKDTQYYITNISNDDSALKTFGFALENLKMDNIFIEPLIEKLSESISSQRNGKYSPKAKCFVYESVFLDLVSQRIDRQDIPFTDYEKAIISYLALNPQEGRKITSYDDILTFVERKNSELESIINNVGSTLIEVKNAYLERIVGLNYESVVNLVTMYGNDPEQLLQNYNNISAEAFKKLSEREALEIIIKLKSLIETQDINAIRSEFRKSISQERKEDSFLRYQKSTTLETTLRRAYGRDMVDSLSKNVDSLQIQELEFEGEKYLVRKVDGDFNRMVSLLGAYRKSSTTEGDMYDRWNTSQMASNHALCYSLINQSNPGTAMTSDKTGIIISIDGFSPESISAEAPYDLCSDNRHNTSFTMRQQRFFSAQNMPNQTRGMYSEYDIEIQDVLSGSKQYKKIQPATIICFEQVDEDSIRAAIELGKKLGHPVPIELIDRRELATNEMMQIKEALNRFKTDETIDPALVGEIITRFNNVRNAHRSSDLSAELLGENGQDKNKNAPFNIGHLNQILKECLANVEQRIRGGQVQEGLKALESIKEVIFLERQKSFLMPTMYKKQLWTGIDMDIDYTLDELQRTYGKQIVKPLKKIKTLELLSQMRCQDLPSVMFDIKIRTIENKSEQLTADQIIQLVDVSKVQKDIAEIHSEGYYQGNKVYDEEHIARVILYSDAISRMEGFDDKTRELLTEVAKYYSCGRQLDILEQHGQYSAKLAGKALIDKYSQEELRMIQATIELQNFQPDSHILFEMNKERELKLTELCSKYGIGEQQAEVVRKMANCISDSVVLDQTRFVNKKNPYVKNIEPNQSFFLEDLRFDSAKKMVKFSYSIQEQLAQQELDMLSSIVQVNFEEEKEQIMKAFFTVEDLNGKEQKTENELIIQSPIVRLEYLKTKFPEIANMDLDEIQKQIGIVAEETRNPEILQLEELKQSLRLLKFKALASKSEKMMEPIVNVEENLQQKVTQDEELQSGTHRK